ncbi:hypothetical protein EVAR_2836_1 [Eumeta japonica]|uniref:Uncharacterized protein n=1 Tax=Eumeta variegata TaxID=151549 RepID=A0A4C1T2Q6_EUMVA|nr:hypothetical protein EVAR_2836_1 [Eumeta japonica]
MSKLSVGHDFANLNTRSCNYKSWDKASHGPAHRRVTYATRGCRLGLEGLTTTPRTFGIRVHRADTFKKKHYTRADSFVACGTCAMRVECVTNTADVCSDRRYVPGFDIKMSGIYVGQTSDIIVTAQMLAFTLFSRLLHFVLILESYFAKFESSQQRIAYNLSVEST